ncbi:DNA packaging protein [Flavobacterium phage FPSV-S1]|nr:DNA packaging protein [Flavobacterium phage FPSV-S1]QCW20635.1 DNA packaging protein [Flavobacterium phage FPSV-S27]
MAKQNNKKEDKTLHFEDFKPKDEEVLKGKFKKGNQMYKLALNAGRKKAFESPEELLKHFVAYCQDVDDNPWIKIDFKGKDADKVEIPMQKPYTWKGFNNYLFFNGLITDLDDYKQNKNGTYDEFSGIIKRIDEIIYDQKMTGATVGAFNSTIIARELGLADKKEVAATVLQETKIGFE